MLHKFKVKSIVIVLWLQKHKNLDVEYQIVAGLTFL